MPERDAPKQDWSAYFARTGALPGPERTARFLQSLPEQARILDFGCGSGRWAFAFARDRPDLTIDLLDAHPASAAGQALPEWPLLEWKGERHCQAFQDFTPTARYDAVWARDTLFFLPRPEQEHAIAKLAAALEPGGKLVCTMVLDTHAARAKKFHAWNEEDFTALLNVHGLHVDRVEHRPDSIYGTDNAVVPSFLMVARKAG